jgi:hypothetical protein
VNAAGHSATQPDGLYRVTTRYLCAGYVIENGKITMCAPILRKRLAYWRTIAELTPECASVCHDTLDRSNMWPVDAGV